MYSANLTPSDDNPDLNRLNQYGVGAHVLKVFDLPDGSHAAFLHATDRVKITRPCDKRDQRRVSGMRCSAGDRARCKEKPRKNDRGGFANTMAAIQEMIKTLQSHSDGNQEFMMLQIPDDADPRGGSQLPVAHTAPGSPCRQDAHDRRGQYEERARILLEALCRA